MTIEQERKELQHHLAAALYMDTPLFSKIERSEQPAIRTQVAATESGNNTNNRP